MVYIGLLPFSGEVSSLLPVGNPDEYLPSHFADECIHHGFCAFPLAAWPASHPNG